MTELEAVREGHQSEVLLSVAEEFPASLCFTLVFLGRQGNVDLVADSPEEAQAWIQGVRKLIHKAQTMDEKERLDQYPFTGTVYSKCCPYCFMKQTVVSEQKLYRDTDRRFPQRFLRWVRDWFQKADKNKDGQMTFKEARTLLKMMNVEMNEEHALHLFTVSINSHF